MYLFQRFQSASDYKYQKCICLQEVIGNHKSSIQVFFFLKSQIAKQFVNLSEPWPQDKLRGRAVTKDYFFFLFVKLSTQHSQHFDLCNKQGISRIGGRRLYVWSKQCKCYLIRCIFQLVLVICQGMPQSLKDKSEAQRYIFVLASA